VDEHVVSNFRLNSAIPESKPRKSFLKQNCLQFLLVEKIRGFSIASIKLLSANSIHRNERLHG